MKKLYRNKHVLISITLVAIIVSFISVIGFLKVYSKREILDDIFGKSFDFAFIIFVILPYSASLITVLYSGYQYIFLNDDSESRLCYRKAITLSLFVFIDYIIMAILAIISLTSKTEIYPFMSSVVPPLFAIAFLVSCTGTFNLIAAVKSSTQNV